MQKIMYETVEYATIAFVLPFRLPRIFCVLVLFADLLSGPLVNSTKVMSIDILFSGHSQIIQATV